MKKLMLVAVMALASIQSWADGFTYYYFTGKMGGRVSVEIVFQKFEDTEQGPVAGYILYPKAKNPAPILIVGDDMGDNYYHLAEYQPDGTVTGWLNLTIADEDAVDGPTINEGEWINPKTGASFSLSTLHSPYNMLQTPMYLPDWWPDCPLSYDQADSIGHEYAYQQWNQNYHEMMGGSVTFTPAGKDRLHFQVSNCPGNIAEGSSEAGRPAVLDGYEFTYSNVNECGYGFKATFFEKFVRLESTTGFDTFGCFGMNTTFEGVYIKIR